MHGFEEILARYGQDVTVSYSDGRPQAAARAFLQPVVERREDWRQTVPTALGIVRRDRFLYLGEPRVSLEGGEALIWKGRRFWIQTLQPIYIGKNLSHWWAVVGAEELPEEDAGT